MKKLLRGLGSLLLLAAVMWAQVGPVTRADDPNRREYWYSSDPAAEVLVVRFIGGLRAGLHTNTIFGDGRYEYKLTDHTGEEQWGRKLELQLSQEEVEKLLDRAVNAGLMEYDKNEVEQRMLNRAPPFHIHDAVTMFLDINLERYRGPGMEDAEPTSSSMSIRGVGTQARVFADIEEIQALRDIAEELTSVKRRAEALNAD